MNILINIFSYFSFIFAVCSCEFNFAQYIDSVNTIEKKDTLKIFLTKEDDLNFKNISSFNNRMDTSLTGIHKYKLLNYKKPFTAHFSNSGLAYRDLEFDTKYNFEFLSSYQFFKDYFLTNVNANYYNANIPFANAFFETGPKREQIFDVLFTRNFKKNLNLSLEYKLIHSPGKYLRQKSDDAFVLLTGNYMTKNNRYSIIGDYFYNRLKIQENGGLKNDSDFTENLEPSRQFMNINLYNAENTVKESGFYIRQFYFLGYYKKKEKDISKTNILFSGFGRISHSILFKNQSSVYIDDNPISGFYHVTLLDTTSTRDSVHVNTIENTLDWSNINYKEKDNYQHLIFCLSVKHIYSKIFGNNTDTTISSIIPQGNIKLKINNNFEFTINSFYFLNGYNKGDYSSTGIIKYKYNKDTLKPGYFGVSANYFMQSPAWFDQQYYSNNFFWDYNFNSIYVKKSGLFYYYKNLNISVNYFQIKNYIYYDNYARPKQFNDNIELLQFVIKKDFKWKKWEIDNEIFYQKTFGTNLIRMPNIESNNILYFTQKFFKSALLAQFGMEVTFINSYYPMAWMPAIKEFYLQNDFKSDNYPYIDIFVNLKIKSAKIYFKMDHMNSGFTGYNYFLIPHYPMSDRAFKFGISWAFYN